MITVPGIVDELTLPHDKASNSMREAYEHRANYRSL